MTILTAELGLAVVFPNWKAPSPLLVRFSVILLHKIPFSGILFEYPPPPIG